MNDNEILSRIEELVNEEHTLTQRSEGSTLPADEHERMKQLEINLDQCWDLLRQRRASRNAGKDPDEATVRDPGIVEHYQQ